MTVTLARTATLVVNFHSRARYGEEDLRTFPTTRAGALEFLELMQIEAPHVWYDLLGIAAEMEDLARRADDEWVYAPDLMSIAEWWRQEPLDALVPAQPDHNGHYWVNILDHVLDGEPTQVDTFPLFRGLTDTARDGRVPIYLLQGVLEARGYVDAAEAGVTPPPASLHAGETQQYRPVNIIREGEL